jgi:phenylpropionate dioxygenase-like ring-hydroxylating dioxygenase large terminal subunit
MTSEFNFFQQWYPVTPLIDLDPNQPTKITLLGFPLVIWKPLSSSKYQVFLNQCPHRLAPLSEGRIDEKTGNLMCSYHGWQFNPQGTCTHIPQAENPTIIEKNHYCVQVFPTQEANDLLWIWADPQTPDLATQTPLPLSPQIDTAQGFVWSSIVRDLEYDWQTLIENVADPSHVPFAHHGVQGNREKATPINLKITESTKNLIKVQVDRFNMGTITFEPPCRLEYAINLGNTGKQVGLIVYCVPTQPGKSRIVGQFARNFAQNLQKITPRWWEHLMERNLVLDGDMVFLHYQERFLEEQSTKNWKQAYQMPTSADRMVIEFRKWFDQYCDSKLPWHNSNGQLPPLNENRQFLLDRYHQHTQHCSSCRQALKKIQIIKLILLINFILTISAVAIMPETWRLTLGLWLIAFALVGLGVYSWLKLWLEPKFYFVDYIHAHK